MLIALIGWAVGFGVAAGLYAARRGRPPIVWGLFGAILGPVALLLLSKAPPARCNVCLSTVQGWAWICGWCGSPVATTVPATRNEPQAKPSGTPAADPATVAMPAATLAARNPEFLHRSPSVAITPRSGGQRSPTRRGRSPAPRDAAEQRSIEASAAGPPTLGEPLEGPRILASGVFVNGTVGLQIGSRYLIELADERLRVLGPADEDPSSVVFDRSVHEMDATGLNERLILNQRSNARGASILAFISLAGGTPEGVAEEVVQAALAVGAQP